MKKIKIVLVSIFIQLLVITNIFIIVKAGEKDILQVINDDIAMITDYLNTESTIIVNETTVKFTKGEIYNYQNVITTQDNINWYEIKLNINNSEYVVYIEEANIRILDYNFEQSMDKQGFPEDYQVLLRELHFKYPNWNFVAYNTKIEWSMMVSKESAFRKNLISGSDLALRSTMEGAYDSINKVFIPLDGNSWYQANSETIAYYMDPRNFLNEKNIFMFLQLSFNENESEELIQKILKSTFMEGKDNVDKVNYSTIFYNAGKEAGVSPIYLAALARQEQGTSGSSAITGNSFTYNNKTYSGLYNFFNIGASSGADNWKKGLIYANGGEDGSAKSYSRPWTSPSKSIKGGALWIANGYINKGQDTMYFQKFNSTTYQTYNHQYMTNVKAAYSQSASIYNTYSNNNALDSSLTFKIPVYLNMPEKTKLPTNVTYPEPPEDPIPEYTGDLIIDLDLLNKDGYLTGFELGDSYDELIQKIKLMYNEDVKIRIENANGEVSSDTLLSTGQKLVIIDESGQSNFTIIIKGDINGDGKIDTKDYLIYRKELLQEYQMNSIETKAASVNNNDISTKGYLVFRKYLLSEGDIEQ